jgi:hypothetical protein
MSTTTTMLSKVIKAPKMATKVIAHNGRHMFYTKAVEKYGILEVLSAAVEGAYPAETGKQYADLIASRLRNEIEDHTGRELNRQLDLEGKYEPSYRSAQHGYTNDELVKLYLHALDVGLGEDIYQRIFPLEMGYSVPSPIPMSAFSAPVEERKSPLKSDHAPHHTDVLKRTLGPITGFDACYNSLGSDHTIRSLSEYEGYKLGLRGITAQAGVIDKLLVGEEKYLLVRGLNGGIVISSDGTFTQMEVASCKLDESCWVGVELVELICGAVIDGKKIELLVNTADLRLTGRGIDDLPVNRLVATVLETFKRLR